MKGQFKELSEDDIRLIESTDLHDLRDFKQSPLDLPYKEFSIAFSKATPRQRGYIHGLSKKLDLDEYGNLPYYVPDIRDLTVLQAIRVINILIDMENELPKSDSIF